MKIKKFLALGLSIFLGLTAIPFSVAAKDESDTSTSSSVSANGMTVNKTVSANEDGTYTITLEAFATGSTITTEETKEIPTDIVLVLDQSGSMAEGMTTYTFNEIRGNNRQNSSLYNRRTNGGSNNLWYQLEDGSYVSVSVMTSSERTYSEITSYRNDTRNPNYTSLYSNRNNLYALVNGEYTKVSMTWSYSGNWPWGDYVYTYTVDGQSITSTGDDNVPAFSDITDDGKIYLASTEYIYTYSYTDVNGDRQVITQSTGSNTNVTDKLFYTQTPNANGTTRLAALQSALRAFVSSVQTKAAGEDGVVGTDDDVNHRIAVIGFASGNTNNQNYQNTELLIGSNQYGYGTSATSHYSNAFQDMNTSAGVTNVTGSIAALAAQGATRTDLGVSMANGVLNANPVSEGEERNRVVIVFTDGIPTYTNTYSEDVANNAISTGTTMKNNGTTVYTVGIFDGADATSAGNQYSYDDTQKANWFMQQLSSNNGTPQDPSYYLSAGDAETLSNIFQQIANQIQSGGSSSTLNEKAVVKDIISPQFSLPKGANVKDIKFSTYRYLGDDRWVLDNSKVKGVSASIDSTDNSNSVTTNNVIDVTGFNFSENYVGYDKTTSGGTTTETARGYKLVITIPITVREEFLGGNDVKTNTDAAIYASVNDEQAVIKFPTPTVDVSVKNVTLASKTDNIYYTNEFDRSNLTGTVEGRLDKNLDGIMNAYADVTYYIKDSEGNVIATYVVPKGEQGLGQTWNWVEDATEEEKHPSEDTKYTVEVVIDGGENNTSTTTADESVHVFYPELTFKDVEVYYGEVLPEELQSLVSEEWERNGELASPDSMSGKRPTIGLNYTPDATAFDEEKKVNTKDDIPVKVTAEIGDKDITDKTGFIHQDCGEGTECTWKTSTTPNDPAFLLHVIYGQLEITKVDADEKDSDGNYKRLEGAVFEVTGSDGTTTIEGTTTEDGTVIIEPLKSDTYKVKEISAPAGYSLTQEEIEDVTIILRDDTDPTKVVRKVTRLVKDRKLYALPNSGSSGTYMFTIGGVAVMMTALLLLLYKRQKERRA